MNDTEGKQPSPDYQDAGNRNRRVMFSDQLGVTDPRNKNSNSLSPRERAVAEVQHPEPKKEVMDTTNNYHYRHHKKNNMYNNQNNNRNSGPQPNTTPAGLVPIGGVTAQSPIPISSSPSALGGPEGLEEKPEGLEKRSEGPEGTPEGRGGRRQRVRRPEAPHVVSPELLAIDSAEEARRALQDAAALLEAQERAERLRVEVQQQEVQSRLYGEMRAAWTQQKTKAKSLQAHHPNGENNREKNNDGDHSDVHVKVHPNVEHVQKKSENVESKLVVDDARKATTISVPPPETATKQEKEGQPKVPSANFIIQWTLRLLSRLPGDRIVWKVVLLLAAMLCSRRLLLLLQR
ncbi:hypothetical protein LSM04_003244 [Trypanosoma melophagium]|uniref:uncharacterized protein n=1 Tax=Trypanosoma melophagium TaxID=715481 RepID=UPI003519DB16|nr:hypothetical protein LSM04_003244 [Trypanosoma melophagium]